MAYPWPLRSSSQLPHTRLSILLTGHTQPAKGNKTTEAHAVQAPTKLLQHLIIPTTMGYSSRGKGVSLGTSRESTHFYFWQWNYTVPHLLEERQSACVPTFVGIKGLPKQSHYMCCGDQQCACQELSHPNVKPLWVDCSKHGNSKLHKTDVDCSTPNIELAM